MTMILSCPHCSAVYELPKHLLGAGGAAVRCPHCAGEFTLGRDGEIAAVGAGAGGKGAAEVVATSARVRSASAPAGHAAPPRAPEALGGTPRAPSRTADAAAAVRSATASREPEALEEASDDAAKPSDRAEPASDAEAVARRLLDELAARKGRGMADASARGRLLSEFGPDVIAAFEEFRREIGGTGNPAPFREALRERWGIDLSPPTAG